jgi:hypothetical protein
MDRILDTSFMINPLFGILVTVIIFVIGYLLYDNRTLRSLNKGYSSDIKELNTRLIDMQDEHHKVLLSSQEKMLQAINKSTDVIGRQSENIKNLQFIIRNLRNNDKKS